MIKNDPDLCHIPIVVLTTSRQKEDIINSYALFHARMSGTQY